MDTRDEILQKDLRLYDFSQNHPVRNILFNRLLAMHRMDNMPRQWQRNHLLTDEELDYVAAAGNANMTSFTNNMKSNSVVN